MPNLTNISTNTWTDTAFISKIFISTKNNYWPYKDVYLKAKIYNLVKTV